MYAPDSSCYNFSTIYLVNGCWIQKWHVLCINQEACLYMVWRVASVEVRCDWIWDGVEDEVSFRPWVVNWQANQFTSLGLWDLVFVLSRLSHLPCPVIVTFSVIVYIICILVGYMVCCWMTRKRFYKKEVLKVTWGF